VVDGSQNLMQGETYFDGWLLAGALGESQISWRTSQTGFTPPNWGSDGTGLGTFDYGHRFYVIGAETHSALLLELKGNL